MRKLNPNETFRAIMMKDHFPKVINNKKSYLKRKYPNWNVRYGDIVHYAFKCKEKNPNFDDVKSLPIKLKLKKIRIPSKIEQVM